MSAPGTGTSSTSTSTNANAKNAARYKRWGDQKRNLLSLEHTLAARSKYTLADVAEAVVASFNGSRLEESTGPYAGVTAEGLPGPEVGWKLSNKSGWSLPVVLVPGGTGSGAAAELADPAFGVVLAQYCVARTCHCMGYQLVDKNIPPAPGSPGVDGEDVCSQVDAFVQDAARQLQLNKADMTCNTTGDPALIAAKIRANIKVMASILGAPPSDFTVADATGPTDAVVRCSRGAAGATETVEFDLSQVWEQCLDIANTNFTFHVYGNLCEPHTSERMKVCKEKVAFLAEALKCTR